jgi:hypothetical protein
MQSKRQNARKNGSRISNRLEEVKKILRRKAEVDEKEKGRIEYSIRPFVILIRRRPTFPHSCPCSIIGPARLNFRVRDGNGCDPRGLITGNLKLARFWGSIHSYLVEWINSSHASATTEFGWHYKFDEVELHCANKGMKLFALSQRRFEKVL